MGTNCKLAFAKAITLFHASSDAIETAIDNIRKGGNVTSCNYTMEVVGNAVGAGAGITAHKINDKKGAFDPRAARTQMHTLLGGDEVILVSIQRDHHFTVFPIDGHSVGLLQGFQGFYSLFDWINTSGKIKLPIETFEDNFSNLFSGTASVAADAAANLFALPGHEDDIKGYYSDGGIRISMLASSSPT